MLHKAAIMLQKMLYFEIKHEKNGYRQWHHFVLWICVQAQEARQKSRTSVANFFSFDLAP